MKISLDRAIKAAGILITIIGIVFFIFDGNETYMERSEAIAFIVVGLVFLTIYFFLKFFYDKPGR